jgi:hypothetical protein
VILVAANAMPLVRATQATGYGDGHDLPNNQWSKKEEDISINFYLNVRKCLHM